METNTTQQPKIGRTLVAIALYNAAAVVGAFGGLIVVGTAAGAFGRRKVVKEAESITQNETN